MVRSTKMIVQCKNCQNFGHTANNCSRPFRCVKCKVIHRPGECPTDAKDASLPRNQPACVNCGGLDHPANFRGCPAYKDLIRRKQEKIQHQEKRLQEQQEKQRFSQQSTNRYRHSNISYSDAARQGNSRGTSSRDAPGNATCNSSSENPINYLQQECLRLFNNDLFTIMEKTREFVPRHRRLTNRNEKATEMLNFISSITNP